MYFSVWDGTVYFYDHDLHWGALLQHLTTDRLTETWSKCSGAGWAEPPKTWAQWFLVAWLLFVCRNFYEHSEFNVEVKQNRLKFPKQWHVQPGFMAARSIGARSAVASFLFHAGRIGRWWNEYSPEALENWSQMMVHHIRQALAEEQEHALMDTSSRNTCFHISGIASGSHYKPESV